MIKDENEYLEEWIKYHYGIGVDRFYIYDNNSKEPVENFINENEELKDIDIQVIRWNKQGVGKHVACFNHCIANSDNTNEWCCFIDIDEFIVPTKYEDIKKLIKEYSNDYSAIKIGRYNFGNNGYTEKPEGGVIENFTKRCNNEGRVILKVGGKSIVRLDRAKNAKDPHNFQVIGDTIDLDIDKAQINHYFTKSEEEWINSKMKKGGGNGLRRIYDHYTKQNKYCNEVEDNKILKFVNNHGN